ncbi:MAG: hypothetical protein NVSMB32_07090 [Actinomycetota bacterium]
MFSGRVSRRGGVERYLAHGERVLFALRRHGVVLDTAVGGWLVAVAAGVGAGFLSPRLPHDHLGVIGGWIVLAASMLLAFKAWGWWVTRYVVTNERVLLVEGVLARRVRSVPLSKVTHTDYRRSVPGRILGYGTLSLDAAGSHDGLRELTTIPRPDEIYRLIMSLVSGDSGIALSPSRNSPARVPDPTLEDTGPLPRLIL